MTTRAHGSLTVSFITTLHTTKFRCVNVGKQLKCLAVCTAYLSFSPERQQSATGPYKQHFLSPLPPVPPQRCEHQRLRAPQHPPHTHCSGSRGSALHRCTQHVLSHSTHLLLPVRVLKVSWKDSGGGVTMSSRWAVMTSR